MSQESWIQGYAPNVAVTERINIPITKQQASALIEVWANIGYRQKFGDIQGIRKAIYEKWPDLK